MNALKPVAFCASALFVLIFLGCSENPATQQTSAKKTPPAPKAALSTQIEQADSVEQPKYVYETIDRRDPFTPLVTDKVANTMSGNNNEGILTPLQQFSLDQFRLIGVIVGKGQPAAMVAAPDGKGYVLRKGVKIGKNNGVVVSISSSAVVVEEQNTDFSGAILKNQVELKLTKAEGAK